MNWYRVDLHIHTPGSQDYQEEGVGYLDILRKAKGSQLDIISFTDHNTVSGIRALRKELEELELLEQLKRIRPEERQKLKEYRSLLKDILLLPGFELTATFGFHILGIFPPETTMRELEHILLSLQVPPNLLDEGSTEVGATVDVLTAYRIINESGGLVIAAHANSSHGVAMQGFSFGGQTKIAYTQDPNLHGLEVTDLESKRRRTTANFYNGSKPEYPRRMHCIQGSDAHRINREGSNEKNRLGVGDRLTEIFLPEPTFANLKKMFLGNDFSRTRPFLAAQAPFDHVLAARQQGTNIVQSFHESIVRKGGKFYAVLCDICAFANTNGGAIFVGLSDDTRKPVVGLSKPQDAARIIRSEVEKRITPPLDIEIDQHNTQGNKVLQISVSVGQNSPYVIDEYKIYVRDESDSNLAVRDEIVALVKRSLKVKKTVKTDNTPVTTSEQPVSETDINTSPTQDNKSLSPKTGVEIIMIETRKGVTYYSLRDLRNGGIVHNVTRKSARKLWQYALTESATNAVDMDKVEWQGDIGLWKKYKRGGHIRFDLAQRGGNNALHVYYGVTEDGLHGHWQKLIDTNDDTSKDKA